MRILLLTRSLTSAHGGMQEYVRTLAAALRARQDVTLSVLSHCGGILLLPVFFLRSAAAILLFRGDGVHCTDAVLTPLLLFTRLLRPGLRRSVTVHGLDLVYPFSPHQWMIRWSLRSAQRVVAVSRATAEEGRKRGIDERNIIVIPCGIKAVSDKRLAVSSQSCLLLLGRQVRRKGTVWFLEDVAPTLLRTISGLKIVIAGDGPMLPAIRSAVHRLGLRSSVTVLGDITDAQREELYRSSSLFVMPNIPVAGDMEGFGMVCIEAAAHGLPVVAARLEGVADAVIEGQTGLFFRPLDAASAVTIIQDALARTWDGAAVRASCLQRFAISSVAEQYVRHVFR